MSSAETAVGQYVVSQRQYLECLIASTSLEFVNKKCKNTAEKDGYMMLGSFVATQAVSS